MTIYEKIRDNFDKLSKSEKHIGRFCLDNYLKIGNMTLNQLSEETHSGEATIVRFCKKIGVDSFASFKSELRFETSGMNDYEEDTICNRIYGNIKESIEFSMSKCDDVMIDEIAELIIKSSKVFCCGVGNSGVPAEACAMRFIRNGVNAIYFKDFHFQLIYLNELSKKDIALLFSNSGEVLELVDIAKFLKKRGIKTVAITSSYVSSLASICDYCVLTKPWVGPIGGGNLIAQINQMFVADIIISTVANKTPKETLKAKQNTYNYAVSTRLDKEELKRFGNDQN